ncbi:hypothetical protein TSUD_199100 [Trifolium subterraneum]|uniref:Uncharacterized protein n=1 Tax=Trifolium subterraneum TaxID=3900 RepID=A0A2Z6MA66_TRISU|nr:hypothetical protein TSUD_199100 [Trifolium subterraneum]
MVDAVENIKPICEVEKVGVAGKIFFRLFPGVTQAGHQGSTELNQPLSRSQETCCETNETLLEISHLSLGLNFLNIPIYDDFGNRRFDVSLPPIGELTRVIFNIVLIDVFDLTFGVDALYKLLNDLQLVGTIHSIGPGDDCHIIYNRRVVLVDNTGCSKIKSRGEAKSSDYRIKRELYSIYAIARS